MMITGEQMVTQMFVKSSIKICIEEIGTGEKRKHLHHIWEGGGE